jgi:predicted DNA-binding protein YlxM (UPF0122 family)
MPRFKVTSSAKVELYQYIIAETEEEAVEIWENSDISLDEIDENSISDPEFSDVERVYRTIPKQ